MSKRPETDGCSLEIKIRTQFENKHLEHEDAVTEQPRRLQ